jgi:hypothetical protein
MNSITKVDVVRDAASLLKANNEWHISKSSQNLDYSSIVKKKYLFWHSTKLRFILVILPLAWVLWEFSRMGTRDTQFAWWLASFCWDLVPGAQYSSLAEQLVCLCLHACRRYEREPREHFPGLYLHRPIV